MRFKNYQNSYNNENRIISEDDLWQMAIGEAFDREVEIMSQYRAIGLPQRSELEKSPNARWVEPFTNEKNESDGGYWESIFDKIEENLSTGLSSPINDSLPERSPVLTGQVEKTAVRIPEILNKIQHASQVMNDKVNSSVGNFKNQMDTKLEPIIGAVKNTMDKYEGLTPVEAAAKAASKMPTAWTAHQYYGHAAHIADGEEPSLYMKKNNDFYKYGEIKDENTRELLKAQAAKMKGVDLNDPNLYEKIRDVDVVIPKSDSDLVKKIKNSDEFKRVVIENSGELMNNAEINSTMEYPFKNLNLWGTLHKSNLNKLKNSEAMSNNDIYNFEKWDKQNYSNPLESGDVHQILNTIKNNSRFWMNNRGVDLNNLGFEQQRKGQLENYILSPIINLSEDERRKIINEYLQKKLR